MVWWPRRRLRSADVRGHLGPGFRVQGSGFRVSASCISGWLAFRVFRSFGDICSPEYPSNEEDTLDSIDFYRDP